MMYEDNTRGKIMFPARKKQLIDFSGVKYGKITPTDIDGFFEMNDNIFIFLEYKYGNTKMPYGQKLAYERLVNALSETDRKAIVVVCKHNVEDTNEDINGANAVVEEYYYSHKWHTGVGRPVKQVIDNFISSFKEIRRPS